MFVPLAGPWLLGRGCAGRRRCGEPGGWCEGAHSWSRPTARAGALRASGDMSSRAGTSLCGRGRSTPSGTGILSPNAWAVPGWSGPRPAARNVPLASGMRSSAAAAEAHDPCQSRRCTEGRRSGVRLDDMGRERSRSTQKTHGDKPDLFLVHLRSVQGSGILCGNRSTSYSGRRISDRSGRPSVAFHQSNRQGRSRAPSSGQVWDDVPRGDQGSPGR